MVIRCIFFQECCLKDLVSIFFHNIKMKLILYGLHCVRQWMDGQWLGSSLEIW